MALKAYVPELMHGLGLDAADETQVPALLHLGKARLSRLQASHRRDLRSPRIQSAGSKVGRVCHCPINTNALLTLKALQALVMPS